MRGPDTFTESLFSIKRLDDFVPQALPLRAIRAMTNDALSKLEDLFAGMYEDATRWAPQHRPAEIAARDAAAGAVFGAVGAAADGAGAIQLSTPI